MSVAGKLRITRTACASAWLVLGIIHGCLPSAAADDAPKSRSFRLTCSTVVKDIPESAERLNLWIPYPPNNEHQTISNVRIVSENATTVEKEQEYGNQALFLTVAGPIRQPVRVELQFDVLRHEYVRRTAGPTAKDLKSLDKVSGRWLQPDKLVPLDNLVRSLAAEVSNGEKNREDQVRAIFDYTVRTMEYDKTGTGWGRGDIHFACDAKRGNCTDFHALLIGLCRAVEIPARFEIGFSIPIDRQEGEITGYHCWAECYLADRGWIPVDASEARKNPERREYFFGAHDENRVALSVGRDIRLKPAQNGEPLNFFVNPYAEVDGKEHSNIERKVSFRDLPKAP
jgi:transglutaminase-like putative cysteine protease